MYENYRSSILDNATALLISILFRIVLIIYAIIILFSSEQNYFDNTFYVIVTGIYAISSITLLLGKKKIYSKVRVLNDYLFIYFILFSKEVNSIELFIFLFLPIFNSKNHSGEKKPLINYILLYFAIYATQEGAFSLLGLFSLLSLLFIEFFNEIKSRIKRNNIILNSIVDDFLNSTTTYSHIYEILEKIKNNLNQKIGHIFCIEEIVCLNYNINSGKRFLRLISSTPFIWSYEVENFDSQTIKRLTKGHILLNKPITINNNIRSSCIWIPINYKSHFHVYIFTLGPQKSTSENFFRRFVSAILLKNTQSLLRRISTIQKFHTEISKIHTNSILKNKSHALYVDKAILVLHFLRNKFTPIVNHFEMTEEFKTLEEKDPEKANKLSQIINESRPTAEKGIKEILKRANQILDKTENPFIIKPTKNISLRKIFEIIRATWIEKFDPSSILFNWNVTDDSDKKHKIKIDEDAFNIVVTDIVENSHRHGTSDFCLSFDEIDNRYSVLFKNKPNILHNQIDALKKLMKNFSEGSSTSINNSNSHGLYLMKNYLLQMEIEHKFYIDEQNIVNFVLIFDKTVEDETSDL